MTPPRYRAAGDALVIWAACAVAAGLGWYVAGPRLGSAIDAQVSANARVAAAIDADDAAFAARPRLRAQERQLDTTLAALDIAVDRPTAVAHFIRESARITALHHVQLIGIDDVRAAALDRPSAVAGAQADPLERTVLEMTLRGSYAGLLATMRDLARAPLTIQLDVTAIERRDAAGDGRTQELTARLAVRIARLAKTPLNSSDDTRTREAADARPL